MEDHSLSKYIPSYGDRIALFNFCRRSEPLSKRKMGLFEKLRNKMKLRKTQPEKSLLSKDHDEAEIEPKKKLSVTRMIEVGWINEVKGTLKQVRTKQGGGTRKVKMSKEAGKTEILHEAKKLFFPNGNSPRGKESLFTFDVCDFQQNPLSDDITIGKMYELVKLSVLRFYLKTVIKADTEGGDSTYFPSLPTSVCVGATQSEHYSTNNTPVLIENILMEEGDIAVQASALGELTNSDNEINFGPLDTSDEILESTLLWLSPSPAENEEEYTLTIHHANCLTDMITAFSNPEILRQNIHVRRLFPDGSEEPACGSGVMRDTLCHFWEEFYERCTLGNSCKVPFIRHDFTYETWKAIARIILKGYKDCGYLPIKLALPFMHEVLFGSIYADIIEYFFEYVSYSEKETLATALDTFSAVDEAELMDVLDDYGCRRKVTSTSYRATLFEIAHKELIQKPMFVIDAWKEILQEMQFITVDLLSQQYTELQPTCQKVLKQLEFPIAMSPKENEVSKYLKKYIRELTKSNLCKFLRYCTGSDLNMPGIIYVQFEEMPSFSRRPIARTCGRVLHLSENYENYPDFRSEFNGILDCNIWVMEIV
ncbi:uncharacterized protein [Aquarana catesbeiana]